MFAAFIPYTSQMVSADSYYDEETGKTVIDTNYWFRNITVNVDVRRDKTLAVTERFTVGFLRGEVNTGFIRDIQRISRTTRIIDGKKDQGERYIAKISNVSVTINGGAAKVTEELYNQGQFHSIKMQLPDESYFPATDQSDKDSYNIFELSYIYDISDDKARGYDDFTFDVLGYAMAYTKGLSVTVTFPENIEGRDVSMRTNQMKAWEPTAENGERFIVSGNTVRIGAAPNKENKGYTLQVILPDGFFQTESSFYWEYIACAVLALCGVAAGLFLFFRFRQRKPIDPIAFYPPEDMRAMRFSSVYYGGAREKDIAAVIVQWAQEGYVRIDRDGVKDLYVHKIKDLPDDVSDAEKAYFDEMFKPLFGDAAEDFSTRAMLYPDNAKKASRLSRRVSRLVSEADIPNPLSRHSGLYHVLLTICLLIPLLAVLIYGCSLNATLLPLFFFVFIAAGTGVGSTQARSNFSPLMYVFPIAFLAMPMVVYSLFFYMPRYDYAGMLWLSLIWWAIAFILLHFYKQRSPEVMYEYAQMLGFKRFLLTAELPRLEKMLDDDPEYYYHIIPYCLIMGIGEKVEKRFAPLGVAAPEWTGGISLGAFSSFTHSLSSSSGGGSSGGGGSGGSSGGGGGGGGSRGC